MIRLDIVKILNWNSFACCSKGQRLLFDYAQNKQKSAQRRVPNKMDSPLSAPDTRHVPFHTSTYHRRGTSSEAAAAHGGVMTFSFHALY